MAISDLLWACPACGEDRALTRAHAVCSACGTRFLRGLRGTIRAVSPDGGEISRSATQWVQELPHPAALLENDPIRTARVRVRTVTGGAKVFGEAGYLNRVEVFGPDAPGRIRLHSDRLIVERQTGSEGSEGPETWPLETLSAVQASSNSLQLKRKGAPLVAFRFEDDAIYLWEHLLRAALRELYRRTGRGEIREFQPRIETR